MNCYKCEHSRTIPGDAHLSCKCPPLDDPENNLLIGMASSIGNITGIKKFGITFNPHGVRNGWCSWPMKFDPCWIDGECKMFKER